MRLRARVTQRRGTAALVILVVVLSAGGAGLWRLAYASSGYPMSGLTQYCQPRLVDWSGEIHQCFRPTLESDAEARLPFTALRPDAGVRVVVGLRLNQVTVAYIVPHDRDVTGATPLHVSGITYLFGEVPGNDDMIPSPLPAQPQFIIVDERAAQAGQPWERVDRAVGTVTVAGRSRTRYGPWTLQRNIPGKGVFLTLTTNAPKETLTAVAAAIERVPNGGR